jgi:hypothetical protein
MLRSELKSINETLRQIEDDIRERERRQDVGSISFGWPVPSMRPTTNGRG